MIELFSFQLSYLEIALLALSAMLFGMAKTGISGAAMLAVPIAAVFFGGKLSSGILLPIMIMADLFAVAYFNRHAKWQQLWRLFPTAAVGVVIGTYLGNLIDDDTFRQIMGTVIFVSLGIMIWREKSSNASVPNNMWFAIVMGLTGGVTSMIGNLAGSIMALYLLSIRLPKNEFIGTAAWFFFVLNLFKVPFHVFTWQTITFDSLKLNLLTLPFVALGAYLGMQIVKRIPEQAFRWLIIATTAVAAVFMLV